METKNLIVSVLSMITLMFSKIVSVFFGQDTLMSKQAVDLLNDPKTREEFLEFTTGINSEGKRVEPKNNTKTFTKQNGEQVTFMKLT